MSFVDVKTEYAKDKNLKKEDVKSILTWVGSQPHLPKINEFQAIAFLKKNHYYIEPTEKNIDTYFSLKKLWPDFLVDRNITKSTIKGILDTVIITPLPKKTPEGYTLILIKILNSDIVNFETSQILKYFDIVTMLHLYHHGTSEGNLVVIDLKNLPYAFLQKLDLNSLKRYFYFMQEVMPINWKGLHYFTSCPFMDEALALVRSVVTKPLLPFIYFHEEMADMEKYVPTELLPVDYGGSVESVEVLKEKLEQELVESVSLFEWEDEQVIDDAKRPSKGAYNIFDVENGLGVNY